MAAALTACWHHDASIGLPTGSVVFSPRSVVSRVLCILLVMKRILVGVKQRRERTKFLRTYTSHSEIKLLVSSLIMNFVFLN